VLRRARFRFRCAQGQVLALTALGMVGICGIAGFVVDVGSWYQTQRQEQAIADASALAAVRNLPGNQAQASADAQSYATKNGGSSPTISYSTKYMAGDTITVSASTTAPSYFLKALGIGSQTVSASATATAENLQSANGAMPFGVINTQPQLSGSGCPCYGSGNPATLSLGTTGPGGFGIINIDGSRGGTSPGTLAGWIQNGCTCSTSAPVWLYSDPGAKFNSSLVKGAMNAMIGHNLLFPVYDTVTGNGANLQYRVIGWSVFYMTSWAAQGSSGSINGYFVKMDWSGTTTTSSSNYFGATGAVLTG
jgi:hypothetical protein